jgi:hypothetical protein
MCNHTGMQNIEDNMMMCNNCKEIWVKTKEFNANV